MADIPRDPRQLARDILAGKVRIEDLQRERQARGGAPAGPRTPEKIPLPRPAQQAPRPPAQQQRTVPVQRPPQPQRPAPVRQKAQPRIPQPQRPMPIPEPPPQPVEPPSQAPAAGQPYGSPPGGTKARRGLRLNELVKSRRALRQGILLSEVLGKPVSLRDTL